MHEVTMIVGIKSLKYGPKFPNFMGVARENLLCFKHEHGHVPCPRTMNYFVSGYRKDIVFYSKGNLKSFMRNTAESILIQFIQ